MRPGPYRGWRPNESGYLPLYRLPKGERPAFHLFGIFGPPEQLEPRAEITEFLGRSFCSRCEAHLFSANNEEAEMKLGSLHDAPTGRVPTYELWVKRRETWLPPIFGVEQFEEDHT